ncbi:hypothetical protein CPB84DRAFT_1204077 [Gymnopilus junonius]|uniref:Uncharacterized protein n=1 Tax=Gymnopilus junonius TaxID=109634 RepID=A0A9P5NNQ6_GYMJU|nr:hypothetical protein CPB84DRAFT_1204077 [Gymnopilus junonius]
MATSRKTSARTGKVQRGHVPPEDVPAIESDTGSPAARGDSEQVPEPDHRVSGSNLTGSEVADVRGRGDRRVVIDSHGKVNREAETGGAAAARPARRSNSLDSARYTPVVPEHVTGNPVLQDARQVVMETRGMVNTLVERLGRIEKVLGLQENSSSMERTIQHTEESQNLRMVLRLRAKDLIQEIGEMLESLKSKGISICNARFMRRLKSIQIM